MASHLHAAPRLACVKPVASVHPEPGSNSTLYNLFVLITCTFDRHAIQQGGRAAFTCLCQSFKELAAQGQPLKSGCKSTAFTANSQIYTRKNLKYIHILTFDYSPRAKSAVLHINYINKKIHILRSIQQTNYLLTKKTARDEHFSKMPLFMGHPCMLPTPF